MFCRIFHFLLFLIRDVVKYGTLGRVKQRASPDWCVVAGTIVCHPAILVFFVVRVVVLLDNIRSRGLL